MNTPINRRVFLQGVSATSVAGALACRARHLPAAMAQAPDLALKNAVILTMDDARPKAEAMSIQGERIVAVGSNLQIEATVSPRTRVVDLRGRYVSPGLIDAHSHLMGYGQMELKFVSLRPPEVTNFKSLGRTLAEAAKEIPAGEWIVGRGFENFSEGRFPYRWELDKAVPRHPVLAIHWGGQFGVANTSALEKAKLLWEVDDPYGGKFLRDRNGIPDGRLLHYPAIYAVYQPELDDEEQVECATWAAQQFAAQGVTCVHDNFCAPLYARVYARLAQQGKLPCRVRTYAYVKNLEHCRRLVKELKHYDGPLVRMQGVKLAVDGYALMYSDMVNQLSIPMHPQPAFEEMIATIHQAGWQADVHAVGDKGVDWTLDAFVKATGSANVCRESRHRIEHFPFRKRDSILRAAELGVPVCLQPAFIQVRADHFLKKFATPQKHLVQTMLPIRSFLDAKVSLAFGADVPAFPSHSPMTSIRCAMDRQTGAGLQLDRSEAISFLEALRIHTIGSAYATFDEDELGSLASGKKADFVVWNGDLESVRSGVQATSLQPLATFVGGRRVYRHPGRILPD